MGYARIIGGGPKGRYTIELDYGEATRAALLGALDVAIAGLTLKLSELEVKLAEAKAKEDEQVERIKAAQDAYIATSATLAPGSPRPDSGAIKFEMLELQKLRLLYAPLRTALQARKYELATARKRRAYWADFAATETRQAWCADFTEDAAIGSLAATVDVPGESNLLLIAPGARPWNPSDGVLTARELMSPEQVFFNAAILPGWQKFKPTYRWGTITSIDKANDTASVDLFDATSSARRLPVNQTGSLADVPIQYQTCNSACFEVGDRVIVKFNGQEWSEPRIIGFLDNPKPCDWQCWGLFNGPCFATELQPSFDAVTNVAAVYEGRIDGGEWFVFDWDPDLQQFVHTYESLDGDIVPPGTSTEETVYLSIRSGQPSNLPPGTFPAMAGYVSIFVWPHFKWQSNGAFPVPGLDLVFSRYAFAEVRITVGGSVVFNAAARSNNLVSLTGNVDPGWGAKSRSGINNRFNQAIGTALVVPVEYTLSTEE